MDPPTGRTTLVECHAVLPRASSGSSSSSDSDSNSAAAVVFIDVLLLGVVVIVVIFDIAIALPPPHSWPTSTPAPKIILVLRVFLKDVGVAMTRLQTQDEGYHWIYFFGTHGAPTGRGFFDRLLPHQSTLSCSHRGGDGESGDRGVWLTGQEEEGHLPRAGINLVFLPF